MLRKWKLDGEDSPVHRAPQTWEEVCTAIDTLLSTRCDAKAPTETVAFLADGFTRSGGGGGNSGDGTSLQLAVNESASPKPEDGNYLSMYDFYSAYVVPFAECLTDIEREGICVDEGHLRRSQRRAEAAVHLHVRHARLHRGEQTHGEGDGARRAVGTTGFQPRRAS